MVLVDLAGVLATAVFAPPGTYTFDAASVAVDPFYLFVPLFTLLAAWSGYDLWRSGTAESEPNA